ncbi:MAG: hypothetical protein ABI548_27140 [Polyangiaceae bacterium]
MARSTVSRAVAVGGPLHAALVADRVDAGHPAVVAWVGPVTLAMPYGLPLREARELGLIQRPTVPACGACGQLYAGGVYAGTPVAEFAERAETSLRVVTAALTSDLAPALLEDGRINIGHPAALAFLARYPLARNVHDDPLDPPIDGHDFTCPASIDESRHDVRHPIYQAFLARYFGRVPTEADAAEFRSP